MLPERGRRQEGQRRPTIGFGTEGSWNPGDVERSATRLDPSARLRNHRRLIATLMKGAAPREGGGPGDPRGVEDLAALADDVDAPACGGVPTSFRAATAGQGKAVGNGYGDRKVGRFHGPAIRPDCCVRRTDPQVIDRHADAPVRSRPSRRDSRTKLRSLGSRKAQPARDDPRPARRRSDGNIVAEKTQNGACLSARRVRAADRLDRLKLVRRKPRHGGSRGRGTLPASAC